MKKFLLLAVLVMMAAGPVEAQSFLKKMKQSFNEYSNGGSSRSNTYNRSPQGSPERNTQKRQQMEVNEMGESRQLPQSETNQKAQGQTLVGIMKKAGSMKFGLTGKPLPVAQGWTLVRSNTIAGFKCDHYEKNGKELRVFWKDNGDFITLDEDPDGLAREPKSEKYTYMGDTTAVCPIGEYRLTTKAGIVINGNFDDFYVSIYHERVTAKRCKGFKLSFPDGDAIGGEQKEMSTAGYQMVPEDNSPINWDNFKAGDKKFKFQNFEFYTKWLYLKEDPDVRYPYYQDENNEDADAAGFIVGDRKYAWDLTTGALIAPFGQYVGNDFFRVNSTDTIVSVKKGSLQTDPQYAAVPTYQLTYANGDEVTLTRELSGMTLYKGTLHRPSGVVTIKTTKGKTRFRIEYPDGKVFAGQVAGSIPLCKKDIMTKLQTKQVKTEGDSYSDYCILSADDMRPWTGAYEYPDGSVSNLTKGKTDQELAAEKAAQEAAEAKAKAEKEKARKLERQALDNKYGKRYVDIAENSEWPVVGMPIELIQKFYDCRLSSADRYSQVYHLYGRHYDDKGGYRYTWLMSLYVRNGRVSSYMKWF